MKLDQLNNMDGYSNELRKKALFDYINSKVELDVIKITQFKEKWLAGNATLYDWIEIGPINIDEILGNLSGVLISKLKERQKLLYNLWLESKLQFSLLYDFNKVLVITPDQVQDYAKLQLQLIDDLLGKKKKPEISSNQYHLKTTFRIDYNALYKEKNESGYSNKYDIHGADKMVHLDVLLRYKYFLEEFIKDPVIEREDLVNDEEEIIIDEVFSETLKLLGYVQFRVSFVNRDYKGKTIRSWSIESANDSYSSYDFRSKLKSVFRNEYRQLLHSLRQFDFETQESLLLNLAEELTTRKDDIIIEGTYRQQEGEHSDGRIISYKRLSRVGFVGSGSMNLAFNQDEKSTFSYLLKVAQPFAIAAEEVFNSFVRKLEETANNLDVLDFSIEVAAESIHDPLSFEYTKMATEPNNITLFYNALKEANFIERTTSLPSFYTHPSRHIGWYIPCSENLRIF